MAASGYKAAIIILYLSCLPHPDRDYGDIFRVIDFTPQSSLQIHPIYYTTLSIVVPHSNTPVFMLRRSLLSLARRPMSTMASQTPMEDAMRRKVRNNPTSRPISS